MFVVCRRTCSRGIHSEALDKKIEAGELISRITINDEKLKTLTAKAHETVDDIPDSDTLIDYVDVICLVHTTFTETTKSILALSFRRQKARSFQEKLVSRNQCIETLSSL